MSSLNVHFLAAGWSGKSGFTFFVSAIVVSFKKATAVHYEEGSRKVRWIAGGHLSTQINRSILKKVKKSAAASNTRPSTLRITPCSTVPLKEPAKVATLNASTTTA